MHSSYLFFALFFMQPQLRGSEMLQLWRCAKQKKTQNKPQKNPPITSTCTFYYVYQLLFPCSKTRKNREPYVLFNSFRRFEAELSCWTNSIWLQGNSLREQEWPWWARKCCSFCRNKSNQPTNQMGTADRRQNWPWMSPVRCETPVLQEILFAWLFCHRVCHVLPITDSWNNKIVPTSEKEAHSEVHDEFPSPVLPEALKLFPSLGGSDLGECKKWDWRFETESPMDK